MTTYALIVAPILVALAGLFIGLGVLLVRSRYPTGSRWAGLAMMAVAVWLFGAASEGLATDTPALYSLVRAVKYVGVATVGPVYLVFVLRFALGVRLSGPVLAGLFLIPAVTIALVWTNPLHELMWRHPDTILGRGDWGPWFRWVHTPYSYLTIVAGIGGLLVEIFRGRTLRRAQSAILAAGAAVPLVVNAIYLTNPELPDLHQTPLSFGFTALVFGWGFFRFHLFRVSPLALRAAFDAVGDAVLVVDLDRRIADLNPAAERLLAGPDGRPDPGRPLRLALTTAGIDPIALEEGRHPDTTTPDGRRFETDVRSIRDRRDDAVRGWIVVLRDVTDQRRAEAALRESEAMMRSVLDRSPLGILRLAPVRSAAGRVRDFVTVLANPTAQSTVTPDGAPLVGRTLTDVRPPHTPVILDTLRQVHETGEPREVVLEVEPEEGTQRWFRLNAVPVGDDVSLTFVDITSERQLQQQMTAAAHTDPLTGLLNRRGLAKDGARLLRSALGDGRAAALLFVDLDDFKAVNDGHGHDAGDEALRAFAKRLERALRGNDLLARVGGDEFVILLQDPTPDTVRDVSGRILELCGDPVTVWTGPDGATAQVRLGCSIGSARLPEDGRDVADLMRAADAAMYRFKDRPAVAGE
jgi:diguanylate cyclase (GGDEF)-like protein